MDLVQFVVDLAIQFWQFTLAIIIILIGAAINALDLKERNELTFNAKDIPQLKPLPMETKGKGFWGGYKYETLLLKGKKKNIGIKDQKWMDETFRDININVNGFYTMNYLAYWTLRLGGFVAWRGHRKRNIQID